MANSIPKFRERECEWKFPFPISGTGMRVENSIPDFRERKIPGNSREIPGKFHSHLRERECKWKIPFPFSGTGMRVANSIPDFRDGKWRPVFPGIPGIVNSRSWLLITRYDHTMVTLFGSITSGRNLDLSPKRFSFFSSSLKVTEPLPLPSLSSFSSFSLLPSSSFSSSLISRQG